jgi:hypothetical protein
MLRGRSGRRIAALLALTVWIGFAGGAEAGEILSRSLGFHRNCHMACCRKRSDESSPRTATASGHHGHHQTVSDNEIPASSLSVSSATDCEGRCALQLGPERDDGLLVSAAASAPGMSVETGHFAPALVVPKSISLSACSPRAPPA